MPEPDPLPAIKTPWGAATSSSGAGAGAGDVPPIPIPDHTLIRRVGKGSYGEVWLARNVLGVYRAVKIIQRSSFDDDRPFEREFAGMQRFEPVSRSHESQLNILQVGRGPDCFYYAMELADDMGRGAAIDEASYSPRNLRSELLLHGRLPVAECVRLGLALTTALEHLHRHGLVHRDIKPSNIVFVNGIPKLADIGLVALAESTMSFVGTEGYLPPEGPGTVQADLFSLGKVLYEISTGRDRQQFPELPTGISELPDRAALAEFNEVLLRACAPDVKQRYESAAEMHADLALLQSGKSVARMRAVERRLKLVARAGAAVTGLALLAGAAFFYQQVQTREARRLASENQALAAAKTQLAEDKSKLAEENRERLVRLDIANGVRLMDQGDYSGALLWFADALPLVTNRLAEDIHRIRIQQTLAHTPRLLNVVAESKSIIACAFSPDGRRIATATWNDKLTLRDARSGTVIWEQLHGGKPIRQVRFSRDGQRLFVGSSEDRARAFYSPESSESRLAEVLEVATGRLVLPRPTSDLLFSAFSPDDRWLAVAFTNHLIQLLDTRPGQLVVELKGHTDEISRLTFNEDASLLASGSRDGSTRIWRLPAGEPVGKPLVDDQPVKWLALSADGRYLATATEVSKDFPNTRVQVWDVQSGEKLGAPMTETGPLHALFFSPSGGTNLLFTGGEADGVRIWNVGPGVTLQRGLNFPVVRCWAFSPDRRRLALGTDAGFVSIWSTETWDLLFPPFRHTGWVESVNFSSDGQQLLTTSDDGTAKVWSLRLDEEAARLSLPAGHVTVPAPSHRPRGRIPGPIPIPLMDGGLHLVDPDRLEEVQALKSQQTNAHMAGWFAGSTGRYWAVVSVALDAKSPQEITLWIRQEGGFRSLEFILPQPILVAQFNADDSRFVTLTLDGVVRFWRTSDGTIERSVPMPKSLWSLKMLHQPFDASCQRLLCIYGNTIKNQQLQFFDLVTGQLTGKPFAFDRILGESAQLRLSPDGTHLASVGNDQNGTIVDLQTGEFAVPQFKHGGDLFDVDWSPDGKRLLTAGYGVKVWNASTGEMFGAPLEGDMSARWSADGRFIVTRGNDKRARVYDAATSEPLTPFLPHSGYIRWVCITPGNRLITASDPNLLRAWDLKPTPLATEVIADYAKLLSGRRLNAGGVLLPIPAKELAELNRSLRTCAPQLFE